MNFKMGFEQDTQQQHALNEISNRIKLVLNNNEHVYGLYQKYLMH